MGAPGGPQARGIATGSDGNLWVTEPDADRIARVPTSGSPIQEIAPPPCNSPLATFCVSYIAPDCAGNLWFTESTRNKIGRINPLDPTHANVEFPTGCCFPGGIGRATPTGAITEFSIHGDG